MQKLLNSIVKNGTFLLFILLFSIGMYNISSNQNFHNHVLISYKNQALSSFLNFKKNIFFFFRYQSLNKKLVDENKYLIKKLIEKKNENLKNDFFEFDVIPSQIIQNSIISNYNHITISSGKSDGIKNEMGIITSNGVIGVVYDVGENTSGVISLLNKSFKLNAKIKKSNHFGSLSWDGGKHDLLKLYDVPKSANIKIGDTIETGGMSEIFPKGIEVGIISQIKETDDNNYYVLDVSLFEDLANINYVYVIDFPNKNLD